MKTIRIELKISDLRIKRFSFYYDGVTGHVKLYEYVEALRSSPRKKIYTDIVRHYNMHNRRDIRHDISIAPSEIEIPESVKQQVIREITESITFTLPKE